MSEAGTFPGTKHPLSHADPANQRRAASNFLRFRGQAPARVWAVDVTCIAFVDQGGRARTSFLGEKSGALIVLRTEEGWPV